MRLEQRKYDALPDEAVCVDCGHPKADHYVGGERCLEGREAPKWSEQALDAVFAGYVTPVIVHPWGCQCKGFA